jgi:hypothetical protein
LRVDWVECPADVRQVEARVGRPRSAAVDNFRVKARRPRRVVDVAATLEAIATLEEILTQRGPLHKDEITHHLRDRGIAHPQSVLQWNVLEMDCPARQLVDDRWVWLPPCWLGGSSPTGSARTNQPTCDTVSHRRSNADLAMARLETRVARIAEALLAEQRSVRPCRCARRSRLAR